MAHANDTHRAKMGQTAQHRAAGRVRAILVLIVAAYLMVGALYALATPLWQVPDEPAHYNYVRHILETGRLPELSPGDYPVVYLEEIKSRRFPPELSIDSIRYEAHQPPLYYLLGALWARLTEPVIPLALPLRLRLFSLLLGAGTVVASYRVVQTLFPRDPVIPLGVAAFVAFVPMHLAMTGAVNNDALSELLIALCALLLLRIRGRWSMGDAARIGLLLGLAFLTKMQGYVAFGMAGASLIHESVNREDLTWSRALGMGALMLVVALAVGLPWLARNVSLYGLGDPLGLVRHDQVVAGQLTTSQYIQERGWAALLIQFGRTTFQSFWGQFGWMGVVMHPRVYLGLALVTGIGLWGLVGWIKDAGAGLLSLHSGGVLILGVWVAVTVAGFLWWNTRFLQHQGRYLFPALTPLGLAFTLGWLQVLRNHGAALPITLALGALLLAGLGVLGGGVPRFTVAMLLVAGAAIPVGRWLERRLPGLSLAVLYLSLGSFALACLPLYIVPQLSPL